MQNEYDDLGDDMSDLSDDEMYFRHVVRDDHELLAMDMMLGHALSQVKIDN